MTLRVANRARQTWASFEPDDFDAIADLVAAFIETPEPQVWGHLDLIARVDAGLYEIVLVRARAVVAMIEPNEPMLFALGIPELT